MHKAVITFIKTVSDRNLDKALDNFAELCEYGIENEILCGTDPSLV